MADYDSYPNTPSSFGTKSRLVTPGGADLTPAPKAVICATAGSLTIVPVGNDPSATVTFPNVPIGFIPPFRVRRVTAATATVYTVEG